MLATASATKPDRGTMPGMLPGTVLGHEAVGVVEETGSAVRGGFKTTPSADCRAVALVPAAIPASAPAAASAAKRPTRSTAG